MSEYWVSQGRKMCTYCKCWIADNKASINFHEQGKNHKENVKKKLDELRKKGLSDAKKKAKEMSDMERIEAAALASLKKDLSANPSIAGAYGIAEDKVELVKEKMKNLPAYVDHQASNKTPINKAKKGKQFNKKHQSQGHSAAAATTSGDKSAEEAHEEQEEDWSAVHYFGDWYSAENEEGHTYYWNTVTSETSWFPPDTHPPESELVPPGTHSKIDSSKDDSKSDGKLEKDESSKDTEQPKPVISFKPVVNRKRGSAYGAWETIKDEELPDLDLPVTYNTVQNDSVSAVSADQPEDNKVEQTEEPKEKKFKEKQVSLSSKSDSGAPVTFKKRKFGANRQARKQNDDET